MRAFWRRFKNGYLNLSLQTKFTKRYVLATLGFTTHVATLNLAVLYSLRY